MIGSVSQKNRESISKILPRLEVEYIGYVQKNIAIRYMLSSDLLFNSLAEMENSELLISGKLMEYIASGKPILCLGNPKGDAAGLLEEFKNSRVFDRQNVNGMISFLNGLFENWSNKTTFAGKDHKLLHFSRYETTRQLAELLKKYL
jgi:hypothetical protein